MDNSTYISEHLEDYIKNRSKIGFKYVIPDYGPTIIPKFSYRLFKKTKLVNGWRPSWMVFAQLMVLLLTIITAPIPAVARWHSKVVMLGDVEYTNALIQGLFTIGFWLFGAFFTGSAHRRIRGLTRAWVQKYKHLKSQFNETDVSMINKILGLKVENL